MTRNILIFTTISIVTLVALAGIDCDYEDGEKSTVLMTPEVTAAASAMFGADGAALLHAVKLQMDKYDLDVKTAAGRRAWHGKLIRQEIHTNEACKIEVYSNELNGTIWRYKTPFAPRSGKPPSPAILNADGVPSRLAEVRSRRNAERTNTVQTVGLEINAGGK